MAGPVTAVYWIRRAAALAGNEKTGNAVGTILTAFLLPFILIIVCLCGMMDAAADHNRAAVEWCFGDIVEDYAARTVSRNGQPIELSKVEFDIVELLSLHPGQVFSRETIYEQVRGFDGTADNAVVKEHIRRIRNKLGAQYIETVWGCGYKWVK